MSWEHVVSITSHMIDYSISIDSNSIFPASIDHTPELFRISHSRMQFVADRLIEPIPRIQLSILRMFEVKDRLLRREHFHSQITSFSNHFAFLSNIIVRPSKHLNDRSLLSFLVVVRSVDLRVIPDEILIFED